MDLTWFGKPVHKLHVTVYSGYTQLGFKNIVRKKIMQLSSSHKLVFIYLFI